MNDRLALELVEHALAFVARNDLSKVIRTCLDRLDDSEGIYNASEDEAQETQETKPVESWTVGGNHGRFYYVFRDSRTWSCTCPDHLFRGRTCKHILARMHTSTPPIGRITKSAHERIMDRARRNLDA